MITVTLKNLIPYEEALKVLKRDDTNFRSHLSRHPVEISFADYRRVFALEKEIDDFTAELEDKIKDFRDSYAWKED
jgi:hypothetical protein